MTSQDLIPYKRLAGELLISQRKSQYRVTLTTKEFLFQKPHMSYYLLLDDLLGIHPSNIHGSHRQRLYQLTANELIVITQSGFHSQSPAKLVLPFHPRFLRFFCKITGFTQLE
ncbi:hypothetical protein [Risungbinella massiliensis]|uniref:hypothetical protein n=1 Tax=Risungbinella massiliensis TaxID=1329796 RepID=UPI0005CBB45C|nr:hypothetical protein [Risungbinella massiliensis]